MFVKTGDLEQRMTLRSNPVILIFLDTTSIERARCLLETVIRFRIIENQFHPPHHHHGLFKYDAGNVVLGLNLDRSGNSRAGLHEAIRTVITMPDADRAARSAVDLGLATPIRDHVIMDQDSHCFEFVERSDKVPYIDRVVYFGEKGPRMRDFYEMQLGLNRVQHDAASFRRGGAASFRAGRVLLSLESGHRAIAAKPRNDGYLTVFHTPDIRRTATDLTARGVQLLGDVRFTSIGGTVRFADPAGHQFCLYQPDVRCFEWGSGPKLAELLGITELAGVSM
jgi:predicted enzyme related to lactoylglutathione lyase